MTKNPFQILKKPVVTEKSVDAKERARTLCVRVEQRATKVEIREAVQKVFKVKVDSVRTAILWELACLRRSQRGYPDTLQPCGSEFIREGV
ncbi:MAG: 50S ribosomal protein L23, partial [Acidobacteriia bacterium]|nr:50S ribosomal protein L23 [Terriglobia bacterium]